MTVAIAPQRVPPPDMAVQHMLMRFIGALNRRRAYAATHPMVQAAEEQFHEAASGLLATRPVITIGVAKTDLLIDGEPYVTRSSFARELSTRLHRRGAGAVTMQAGVSLLQVRETLAWLATEPTSDLAVSSDLPPVLSGISVTLAAYDQLTLGDTERAAEASGVQLWRTLAQLASDAQHKSAPVAGLAAGADRGTASASERELIVQQLRSAVGNEDTARRTGFAFMDLAAQASVAPPQGRARIGEQLNTALRQLGASSFGSVIHALGERSVQHRFVSQVADVLPVAAVSSWLQIAAQSQEQQLSHHLLRILSKLSTYATASESVAAETVFRGAAQDLVRGWGLDDPNPDEHVALLDRIALHERAQHGKTQGTGTVRTIDIESSRLVQMALEIGNAGADALAAADALVSRGSGTELLGWIDTAAPSDASGVLKSIAISDAAIRQMLLTEPVDRLRARTLLDRLDASSAETLIDVLEAAEARGTRMIVRQRLSEFGADIAPILMARLDSAPWYLVRNILTLLHEIAEPSNGGAAGTETMASLLEHPQVQVRTEAFRVLLLDSRSRESAIRRALRDENERLVVLALQALTESCDTPTSLPREFVSQLMEMVDAAKQSDTVRARMVRALSAVEDESVRDWLISIVIRKSRILRRITLTDVSHTAVAAVHALQQTWSTDASALPVIALVRKEGHDRRWQVRDVGTSIEQAS